MLLLDEAVTLWSAGAAAPATVIEAACDALVAGLDTPALRSLGGLAWDSASHELDQVVPAAMEELGCSYHGRDSLDAYLAAASVYARQCLAGALRQPRTG